MTDGSIAAALAEVRERIAAAARRAGRDPGEVRLVGASKTVPPERLLEVLDAGLADLGENRAQELLAKAPVLAGHGTPPTWHFVGRLQRNKVNGLVPWVTWWHSVDRLPLGAAIARRSPGARILVEVNLGDEPAKGGCAPTATAALVEELRDLGLDVTGLMTVAPQHGDRRGWLAALRELAESLQFARIVDGDER